MSIEGQANVELLTSERENITITLSEDGTVTISHFGDTYTNKAKCIDIFIDVEALEIFLDYGRVSYTQRICCLNPIYKVRIENPNLSAVTLRPYITNDKAAYVAYQE